MDYLIHHVFENSLEQTMCAWIRTVWCPSDQLQTVEKILYVCDYVCICLQTLWIASRSWNWRAVVASPWQIQSRSLFWVQQVALAQWLWHSWRHKVTRLVQESKSWPMSTVLTWYGGLHVGDDKCSFFFSTTQYIWWPMITDALVDPNGWQWQVVASSRRAESFRLMALWIGIWTEAFSHNLLGPPCLHLKWWGWGCFLNGKVKMCKTFRFDANKSSFQQIHELFQSFLGKPFSDQKSVMPSRIKNCTIQSDYEWLQYLVSANMCKQLFSWTNERILTMVRQRLLAQKMVQAWKHWGTYLEDLGADVTRHILSAFAAAIDSRLDAPDMRKTHSGTLYRFQLIPGLNIIHDYHSISERIAGMHGYGRWWSN